MADYSDHRFNIQREAALLWLNFNASRAAFNLYCFNYLYENITAATIASTK